MADASQNGYPIDQVVEGCEHLYNNLFMVPFDSIKTPDDEEVDGNYHFRNPRTLIEKGQAELLDRKLSQELRESIKKNTLLNPLICRWVFDEDNECYHPMVIGGERRYRALEFLIRKKETVKNPQDLTITEDGKWIHGTATADVAYNLVPCQIFMCDSDLDALALSWAENKTRINLTDGHEAAEVVKLRQANATDDKIMEILQQDRRWLAETDRLISSLDADTLGDFLESRIDRSAALQLLTIDDVDTRNRVRESANQASQATHERRVTRLDNRIEVAQTRQEIAEANQVLAQDDELQQEAAREAAESRVEVNTMRTRRERMQPETTAREVRQATAEVTGQSTTRRRTPKPQQPSLNLDEIRDYLNLLLKKNGRSPDGFVVQIDSIKLLLRFINENVANCNNDIRETLREHYGA